MVPSFCAHTFVQLLNIENMTHFSQTLLRFPMVRTRDDTFSESENSEESEVSKLSDELINLSVSSESKTSEISRLSDEMREISISSESKSSDATYVPSDIEATDVSDENEVSLISSGDKSSSPYRVASRFH